MARIINISYLKMNISKQIKLLLLQLSEYLRLEINDKEISSNYLRSIFSSFFNLVSILISEFFASIKYKN